MAGRILAFYLVETLVVTFEFDNWSIATGFPFGHYHYTGSVRIGEVPLIVGVLYCGLGLCEAGWWPAPCSTSSICERAMPLTSLDASTWSRSRWWRRRS